MYEKCPYSEFFWSVFSRIRSEYREILRISPYPVQIWTLFTQCRTFKSSLVYHLSKDICLFQVLSLSLLLCNLVYNFYIQKNRKQIFKNLQQRVFKFHIQKIYLIQLVFRKASRIIKKQSIFGFHQNPIKKVVRIPNLKISSLPNIDVIRSCF